MNRKKLIETLEIVGRALERNPLIPQFEYFHFADGVLFAANEDMAIVAKLNIRMEPFAVHGPTLLNMLRSSNAVDATIKMPKGGGNHITISFSTTSEFEMAFRGPPFIWERPDIPMSGQFNGLKSALASCLTTCSSDQNLSGFNSIALIPFTDKVAVYSCDGDSLTRVVSNTRSTRFPGSLRVSKQFVETVSKLAPPEASFYIGPEWVKVAFTVDDEQICIYGKNLGPATIDYEKIIAKKIGEGPIHGLVGLPTQKSLFDSLSRARVLSDVETAPTDVTITDGNMVLQTATAMGTATDILRVGHSDIEVQISAEKVQEALDGCNLFKLTANCAIFSAGEKLIRIVGNYTPHKGKKEVQSE